ncbi:MAG: hypothetical protein ACPGRH_08345, partial [Alphaproteobacteria bacterium]
MAYTELPEIGPETQVDADHAKHDRIDIWIGRWTLCASSREVRRFGGRLCSATCGQRDVDGNISRQNLFNSYQDRNGISVKFISRGMRSAPNGQPIPQGTIHITPSKERPGYHNIHARLSINPTMMLNQVSVKDVVLNRDRPIGPSMFRQSAPAPEYGEYVLRTAENYIWSSRLLRAVEGPRWRQFVLDALTSVDRTINDALRATARNLEISRIYDYNLKTLETYWEFKHSEPVAFVRQIAPRFISAGKSGRLVPFQQTGVGEFLPGLEREPNSLALNIKLSETANLKVYAKTNRRLRVEVVRKGVRMGHTAESIASIVSVMMEWTEEATVGLNQALESIFDGVQDDIQHESPHSLLLEILGATDDKGEQLTIASNLILEGNYQKVR